MAGEDSLARQNPPVLVRRSRNMRAIVFSLLLSLKELRLKYTQAMSLAVSA